MRLAKICCVSGKPAIHDGNENILRDEEVSKSYGGGILKTFIDVDKIRPLYAY